MILSPAEAARQSWDSYVAAMKKWIEIHRCFPVDPFPAAYEPFRAWWEICEAVITVGTADNPENDLDHSARGKPRTIKWREA
jgi:hypothetical protein